MKKGFSVLTAIFSITLCVSSPTFSQNQFDFKKYLFGEPSTLYLNAQNINISTGEVIVNGVDLKAIATSGASFFGLKRSRPPSCQPVDI